MPVTLKEVAALAGVSRSAVSRTFTPGASISEATRRKVERAAAQLAYSPNALASSLTTGRTRLIGLISNNFHNPAFLEIFDLFTKGLQARSLRPLLVNLSEETNPASSVRMLRQYSVDGAIVVSSTLPPDFADAFRASGIPAVYSFGRWTSSPSIHTVGIDNIECGRMAARTLLARGYKNVGFIGGPGSATSTQDRLAGFLEALSGKPGIAVTQSFAGAYTFQAGRAAMQALLAAGGPAEAYFCGDDVLAIGILSAVQDAGLDVPRDIGLLGLNDMEIAGWNNINLTTIRQPFSEIIRSSIELMVSLLDVPERFPEARLFRCDIVERGTLRGVLK